MPNVKIKRKHLTFIIQKSNVKKTIHSKFEEVEYVFCHGVSRCEPLISGSAFYFLYNFKQLTKPL